MFGLGVLEYRSSKEMSKAKIASALRHLTCCALTILASSFSCFKELHGIPIIALLVSPSCVCRVTYTKRKSMRRLVLYCWNNKQSFGDGTSSDQLLGSLPEFAQNGWEFYCRPTWSPDVVATEDWYFKVFLEAILAWNQLIIYIVHISVRILSFQSPWIK